MASLKKLWSYGSAGRYRKRRILLLLCLAGALGATIWWVGLSRSPRVTVGYAGCRDFGSGDSRRFCPRFWITNHTGDVLLLLPEAIEIKAGIAWRDYCEFKPPQGVLPETLVAGKSGLGLSLSPHDRLDVDLVFLDMPLSGKCRLRGRLLQRLNGLPATIGNIKEWRRRVAWCVRSGDVKYLFKSSVPVWKDSVIRSQEFSFVEGGTRP